MRNATLSVPSRLVLAFVFMITMQWCCVGMASDAEPSSRPNVVILLADDLGFSDLGCYGGEIQTPNLDRLAANGVRFTQFYNTGRCWPTRSAIMTGYYPQMIHKDALPNQKPRGSSVSKRPDWAPLISVPLQQSGYRTYHSGKWHLDGKPTDNGYDRSYWLRDHNRLFSPERHFLDDQPLDTVPRGTDYYTTDVIANYTIDFLKEHHSEHAEQPFFAYVCFNVPHFPLHAPAETIKKYDGQYEGGWGRLRDSRYVEFKEKLGIPAQLSQVERHIGPPYHFSAAFEALGSGEVDSPLPWNELTSEQKSFQSEKMEIHAAMVDRMDQAIGNILDAIEAIGQSENTLVVFLSDNGASAEIMVRGDMHDPNVAPGSAASYLCLGPGFSNASNTPFRRHKTWVHEGGIATPMIAHWPAGIQDKGSLRTQPGHVIDFWPTLAQACNLTVASQGDSNERSGVSLLDAITQNQPVPRDFLWWLHDGHRAYREGNWKIVAGKMEPWQLFDLSQDRSETNDLASDHPKRLKRLVKAWQAETDRQREIADRTPIEDWRKKRVNQTAPSK